MIEPNTNKRGGKRGLVRYEKNPFLSNAVANTVAGVRKISNSDGNRMMVVSETTGEIMAPAGFWHAQEVDKTAFVKLFVNGVKALKDLTGAGTKVFEILYLRVQEGIGKDQVWLTFPSLDQAVTPMSEATFYRGMRELIEKGFIAESTTPGLYFLNPDYIWNGDRLAFIQEYRIASKTPKAKDTKTMNLPFGESQ
jgi:hypothetical protein